MGKAFTKRENDKALTKQTRNKKRLSIGRQPFIKK
jgi:hypothetical protein